MSDGEHTTEAALPEGESGPPIPPNPLAEEPPDTLFRARSVVAFLQTATLPRELNLADDALTGLYYILEGLHSALLFEEERRRTERRREGGD